MEGWNGRRDGMDGGIYRRMDGGMDRGRDGMEGYIEGGMGWMQGWNGRMDGMDGGMEWNGWTDVMEKGV